MDRCSHTDRSAINSEIKQTWQRVFPIKSSTAWCHTPQCNSLIPAGAEPSELTPPQGLWAPPALNLLSRAWASPDSQAGLCAQLVGSSKPRTAKSEHPERGTLAWERLSAAWGHLQTALPVPNTSWTQEVTAEEKPRDTKGAQSFK